MNHKGTVLVCDNDSAVAEQLQAGLQEHDIYVDILTDAGELVPQSIRTKPVVIIVNPDMPGYNAYDVCKHLKKDLDIPVILLFEPQSTTTNAIDECISDDEIVKPLNLNNVVNLLEKHVVFNR